MPSNPSHDSPEILIIAKQHSHRWLTAIVSLALTVAVATLALAQGPADIPTWTVIKIIASNVAQIDIAQSWPNSWETIVWNIRLPRVIAAMLIGCSLAIAGSTYQGLFRNPLADPYLIGVASGAGLAATIVLISPIPSTVNGISLLTPIAFTGAMIAVGLTYSVARTNKAIPVTTLVLAGVAIAFLGSATTTFLMLVVSSNVRPILTWLLGGFTAIGWIDVAWILPYLLPSIIAILLHARTLNTLQLGEEQAQRLGIDVERTKVILVISASLATAAAVSVSGMIGFVGLIAPHSVRLIYGSDHRLVLPLSCAVGAILMVLSDLLARTVISPEEIPVGIITAFLGAPFFLYLLRHSSGGKS